jgi:hypothetical protein
MVVSQCTFVSLHGQKLQTGGGGDVATLLLSMVGGSGSDVRAPLMMSLVLQLRNGLAGRENRGRIFVMGQSVGFTQEGLFTGSYMSTVTGYCNTLAGAWCSPGSDYNWDLVLCSRSDEDGSDARLVTTIQPRITPGTQRRRELGVGI